MMNFAGLGRTHPSRDHGRDGHLRGQLDAEQGRARGARGLRDGRA